MATPETPRLIADPAKWLAGAAAVLVVLPAARPQLPPEVELADKRQPADLAEVAHTFPAAAVAAGSIARHSFAGRPAVGHCRASSSTSSDDDEAGARSPRDDVHLRPRLHHDARRPRAVRAHDALAHADGTAHGVAHSACAPFHGAHSVAGAPHDDTPGVHDAAAGVRGARDAEARARAQRADRAWTSGLRCKSGVSSSAADGAVALADDGLAWGRIGTD